MISLTDIQTLSWWKSSILSVLRRIICMGFAWGLLGALVGVVGYAVPAIRNVEDIMPDHDAGQETPKQEQDAEAVPA